MKIQILVQNKYNPLYKEYLKKMNSSIFGDINQMLNTEIGFGMKEESLDLYTPFMVLSIDSNIPLKDLEETKAAIEQQCFEKFEIPIGSFAYKTLDDE